MHVQKLENGEIKIIKQPSLEVYSPIDIKN